MLLYRARNDLHLCIVQRFVSWRDAAFLSFSVNQIHVPVVPENLHLLDTVPDAMTGDALHEPVALCL